jgi:hypothetical protein
MALSRRFLNLIVDNRTPGAKSLRCIDMARQLFDNTAQPPSKGNGSETKGPVEAGNQMNKAAEKASRLERILLPKPIFNFGVATMTTHMAMHCFPLAGREVLCSDQDGRTFLFDADACNVVTMPDLHKPKRWPISLFAPIGSMDGQNDSGEGHLFIMETRLKSEARCSGQHSDQFEVIVYRKPTATYSCQLLPPPPFVRDPKFSNKRTKINSYAVINGGSEICISVEDAGTYCLDTVKHTWRHVGEWTLPFQGKVEYVPELKLWFGLSAKTQVLAAADLSTMDSKQPELVKTWKELSPCKDWWVSQDAQLVNLGSGRFCIARFFYTRIRSLKSYHYVDDHFAVFTGVDVVPCAHDSNGNGSGTDNNSGNGYCNGSSGKFALELIKYKSRLPVSDDSSVIKAVF